MSVKAMSWVFDHSCAVGNDRVVMLVLADVANDDHDHRAWYSIETIARKAHISERTAQRSLRALCESGEIVEEAPSEDDVAGYRRDRRPNVYRLTFQARGDKLTPRTGCQSVPSGVTGSAPRGVTAVTQYQENSIQDQAVFEGLPPVTEGRFGVGSPQGRASLLDHWLASWHDSHGLVNPSADWAQRLRTGLEQHPDVPYADMELIVGWMGKDGKDPKHLPLVVSDFYKDRQAGQV